MIKCILEEPTWIDYIFLILQILDVLGPKSVCGGKVFQIFNEDIRIQAGAELGQVQLKLRFDLT